MIPKEIGSSGVIQWPTSVRISSMVPCIICGTDTPLEKATTGSCYADGTQAFACSDHTWHKSSWAMSWLRFTQEQTRLHEETERVPA